MSATCINITWVGVAITSHAVDWMITCLSLVCFHFTCIIFYCTLMLYVIWINKLSDEGKCLFGHQPMSSSLSRKSSSFCSRKRMCKTLECRWLDTGLTFVEQLGQNGQIREVFLRELQTTVDITLLCMHCYSSIFWLQTNAFWFIVILEIIQTSWFDCFYFLPFE